MPRARRTPETSTMVTDQVVKKCPACGEDILARVTIENTMGEPVLTDDGAVTVPHESVMTKYSVHHTCQGREVPGEDTAGDPPAQDPPEDSQPPQEPLCGFTSETAPTGSHPCTKRKGHRGAHALHG